MVALFRCFATIFLPVAAALSLALFLIIRFDAHSRTTSAIAHERSRVEIARGRVVRDMSVVATDLRVLTHLTLLQEYLNSGSPVLKGRLESVFLDLARETRRYDQIRYLDADGREIIRINYNDGEPSIVPEGRLQNKRGRYYFDDTLKLDKGDVFVSPLDLNMEHGRLEIPYKPMIRFGMPVFDSAGHKKGIILLNYFGHRLLRSFRTLMRGGGRHQAMLLNSAGYWLSSSQRNNEWGFMLGKGQLTFGHAYPRAWRYLAMHRQGSLLTHQGLFVFTTAYPLLKLGSRLPGSTPSGASGYHWKIVSFIPRHTLFGANWYNQGAGRLLIAVVYLLAALISYLVASIVLRRRMAREEIGRLNVELQQRVEERTASEENLAVTLNSIGDAVIATDTEGRITRMNKVAEQLTGWSRAEALGHPIGDVFHIINQTTREPALIPVAATLSKGTIHGLSNGTILIARDGHEYPVADSCAPILHGNGEIVGAVLVFRDVSKEYETQAALRDSATRMQTILNTTIDGIVTIDDNGMVESINPAAERLFGYGAAEVAGQNVNMLMPEPYRSEHDGYLERYRASGEAHIIGIGREVEGRHRDGSRFPIRLAVSEMRTGSQRHFAATIHDLTEYKQAEQKLIVAKEQAEFANRAKDSFLATMSHEIRTPLSGMLGMLEMLSLTSLDAEQHRTLQAAWDSAKSLLRIVSDILDWSKIEDGKLSIVPRSTSIPQLMQEVINTYSHVASAQGLRLEQHIDARIGQAHLVDALRLSQVLNNFVSNAIKFTKHGEVELRADLLEQVESGERIRFSVRDSGIGIAKDAQQQLFQRYRQGSEDTTRLYGGTGLGLAICRRLTDMMDGKIALESEPGQGSTFSITLTLPISGAPGEALPSQQPKMRQKRVVPLFPERADAPTVLVVDDHPINRDLLSQQLRLLGLRAETAENGEVGVSKWKHGCFALVITDCHMPELDGYGLSRAIRDAEDKLPARPRVPIIGWTANAVSDEEGLCHNAGMDDLLIKPTTMDQLRTALIKWLGIAEADVSPPASSPSRAGSERTGPIDYAELEKVVPDRAAHAQVLQDFLKHIHTDHGLLAAMLEQEDQDEAGRTAHRMKGSSRMVGAREMAEACAAIEQAAKDGRMDRARSAGAELDRAIDRLRQHLRGNGHG